MKNVIAAAVVVLALGFSVPLAAQENQGARIEVNELRYNFGKVAQGVQASHVFEIRSVGTETLVIEQIQPG